MSQREQIISILDSCRIQYQLFEHPAVFTAHEARAHCAHVLGTPCKNLFLTQGGRFFLYILPDDKRADLKSLAKHLSLPKLRFGSAPDLLTHLGVEPGSVSPLSLLATKSKIPVIIDHDLSGLISCHPGTNTASVSLELDDVSRLLAEVGIIVSRF